MGYDTDTRLCGSIAKFNVFIGFSTMDYEFYVDYEAIPIHLVRGIGSLTSSLSLRINYNLFQHLPLQLISRLLVEKV